MRNILLTIGAMILLLIMVFLMNTNVTMSTSINKDVKSIKTTAGNSDWMINKKEINCNHEDKVFCSHLPLVIIETGGKTIKKEETIWSQVKVIDNKNGNNHINNKPDIKTSAAIKYRGNSSYLGFDKKQYHLEFYGDENRGKMKNISVMGMEKECDWILNGPFLDRTLIRNSLLYGISRKIMDWAPDTRYCEVFLDGKYQGVYIMMESIKVSKNRIKLRDFGLLSGETPYMLKRERVGTEINALNSYGSYAGKTSNELSINYPAPDRLLKTQKEWISNDISKFEKALYSKTFDDKETGYSKYIDEDSFIDYYIINEFSMNKDAGFLSTYVYKDLSGKLKMAVWDFNNTFNNYQWTIDNPNDFCVSKNNWYKRLFQDRRFTEKVIKRYNQLRKGVLSDEYLLKTIDDTVLYIGAAVDRNFHVWGYTFNEKLLLRDKSGVYRDPENYKEAVTMLKVEIAARGKFIDENIETLYQYAIN